MRLFQRVAAVAIMVAAAGCTTSPTAVSPSGGPMRLAAMESAIVPASESGSDSIVTIKIGNFTERPLKITGMEFTGDPELQVSYVGWATCSRGCVGTGHWDDAESRRIVEEGREGVLPVTVPPRSQVEAHEAEPVSFILRMRAKTDTEKPCLLVTSVRSTLADGSRADITFTGDRRPLAALSIDLTPQGEALDCFSSNPTHSAMPGS